MDTTIIGEFNLNRIRTILPEIKRQAETKKDFICPASRLQVSDAGQIILPGVDSFKLKNSGNVYATFGEAEQAAEPGESIIPQKGSGEFPLSRTAERQLCQKAGVPLDWIDKIRGD